jgi:hypothetical protein
MSKVTTNGFGLTSVAYVGGMGRSGSTILQAVLGGVDGFVPLGEVRGVWQAHLINELCGCGEPFSNCPFWRQVGHLAFGGWNADLSEDMIRADQAVLRHRQIPFSTVSGLTGGRARSRARLGDALGRVYAAAARVSKSRVLIDSTKDAPYAYLLDGLPSVDLRVVHLVRDPRAVAHSWRRLVERPEYREIDSLRDSHMDRYRVSTAATQWAVRNILIEALRLRGVPTTRVLYEDLVRQPNETLAELAGFLGTSLIAPDALRDGQFSNAPFHTVGGNRARFRTGRVPIREDAAWRTEMPRRDRLTCTVLSLPMLIAYGYRVRGGTVIQCAS